MTLLVDSHCHLDLLDLELHGGDVENAIEEARTAGVCHLLSVATRMLSFPDILHIARKYVNVSVSVGVHPNEQDEPEPTLNELIKHGTDSLVVAIGETGLDYFRSQGDLKWQHDRFRCHIAAAKELNKPLIVHTRDAREDTLRILKEEGADQVGGVMHCFVEDWDTAQRAMDLGFYISFSGIVTFRNALELQAIAKKVPLERMLIETDSPYLAPVPMRGKPNQPAYVRYVAEFIADLRECAFAEVAQHTTQNFCRLFPHAEIKHPCS